MKSKERFKWKFKKISVTLIGMFLVVLFVFIYLKSTSHSEEQSNDLFTLQSSMENFKDLYGEKIPVNGEKKSISGEWGDLEEAPIILQASANYFSKYSKYNEIIGIIKSSNHWTFRNMSLENISLLFKSVGLDQKVCDELISYTKPTSDGKGFITTPPDAILWSFTPEIREKLYSYIGKFEENTTYFLPFHYNSNSSEEWLYQSRFNKEITEKLASMVYMRCGICNISDIHLIVPYLKTLDDWNNLLQILFRTPALDLYLKVGEGQDISKLTGYWGNLKREKIVEPLLKKMKELPGGGKIDVAKLLPHISQNRLNTFTGVEETDKYSRDCLWTMFNFFNSKSDERFADDKNKPKLFDAISKPLKGNSKMKFGDIILFTGKDHTIIHGCVYIADNIVYTKNGQASDMSNTPFIFSDFGKTLALYRCGEQKVNTEFYSRTFANTNLIKLK
jgi:hypothetical protein